MLSLFRPQELSLFYFEIGVLNGQELADLARLAGQGVQAHLSPLFLCRMAVVQHNWHFIYIFLF